MKPEEIELGQNVKLIPLTDEQSKHVETEHVGFKTCDADA